MAEATAFNLDTGAEAERKYLVTAVNTGTSVSPTWTVIGAGIEDSAIELNPDVSTVTDILGNNVTKLNKFDTSQSLEPFTIEGGSALALELYNDVKYERLANFSLYEVLIISAFVGASGSYEAEKHVNCTITPQSIGGSAYVDMPITINFSNDKTHGTVDNYTASSTITFSPAT